MVISNPQNFDMTSPMEKILNGSSGESSSGSSSAEGAGIDAHAMGELMKKVEAAMQAGNFELAIELASLVDEKLSAAATKKSAQKGEEAEPEKTVSKGSAAPAAEDKSRLSPDQPASQPVLVAAEPVMEFSQSEANKQFAKAYDKVVDAALKTTGNIADAMSVAGDWAAKNSTAVISAYVEKGADKPKDAEVPIGGGLKVNAVVEAAAVNSMMAALVDFKDFPTFPVGNPPEASLKTVAAKGKERSGPDMPEFA